MSQRPARLAAASLPIAIKVVLAIGAAALVMGEVGSPQPEGRRALHAAWGALTLTAPTGTIPDAAAPPVLPVPAAKPLPILVPTSPPAPAPTPAPTTAVPVTQPAPPQPQVPPSGCQAALAYLAQNAAPGFVAACPHDADGHDATTMCVGAPRCWPGTMYIFIAVPCPAAYMNEASNSWVLMGESTAPWDPYGYCGEPGNPYG